MGRAYNSEEYSGVLIETFGELRVGHQVAVSSFKAASDRILQVADHWNRRAKIRSEFATKELEILGIVTSLEGGEEKNFTIVNNRILREGEELGDIVVDRIERNRVTFRYQGERIGLVFRRY